MFLLDNKTIVVTGGAGKLGSAYVNAFLECGARVVCLDIVRSQSDKNNQSLYPVTYKFIETDLTNRASVKNALFEVESCFGTPDVLINNAAIDSPPDAPAAENGPFEAYPEASWDAVMNANLKSVFLMCQEFGGAMAKNEKPGSIVNVSSIYGLLSPDQSLYEYRRQKGEMFYKPVAYSVTKSGILNFSRYLAVYWAKQKIRVNSLIIAGVFDNQDAEFLKSYCDRIPVGRMANADDYVGPLVFLASDASTYMTGANLIIDGGWTAI